MYDDNPHMVLGVTAASDRSLAFWTWADVPPIDQYGLKGGSVCLAVAEHPDQLKGITWKFRKDVIVDDEDISPKYKKKVDSNPVNHTLCIKNLTDTDSGIYIANAKKNDWTDSTSSYKLKVLEAVPIPAMQVTYYNSSTGLCNITVNCSGWMFSVCDGGQCPLYQDSLSVSEVNITVSSGNGFIQCIVNNHVSTETKSQRMNDICIVEKKGIAAASLVGIIVGIVTGGLFLVGVGCIISTRRWRSPKEILLLKAVVPEVDNPVSAIPGRPEPQNTPGSEVTSIYITAGRPGAVPASAEREEGHPGDKEYTSPEERIEPQSPPQAETFYSTLQIPAAAQHHPVGKGNHLKKPDTVYCTIGYYPSILLGDPRMLL
ncbi:uncharacterized protein LOC118966162 [Oncorhynchus mykiss]|uniref:uncharacterized protein LOC118966162 n=1 Tax=Oncorhynchus mykiss TaxID=8022 RepID=UPI001878DCC9|nr:uncharacterized protein LOC118966162 [Oncorhynchus mykiss]